MGYGDFKLLAALGAWQLENDSCHYPAFFCCRGITLEFMIVLARHGLGNPCRLAPILALPALPPWTRALTGLV